MAPEVILAMDEGTYTGKVSAVCVCVCVLVILVPFNSFVLYCVNSFWFWCKVYGVAWPTLGMGCWLARASPQSDY